MARAAVRPAAPVRLGRGGEPPGLISPSGVFPLPETDKLLLWTDMSNPDDDTDDPSGFNDDAEMERTSPRASETRLPLSAVCLRAERALWPVCGPCARDPDARDRSCRT